jgi:predicted transcriptional regulator
VSWEDVGFVKSSKHRKDIIQLLSAKNMTPTELSKELRIHISQVTRNLLELEKRNLVKCLTPSLRKGRLYSATDKGIRTVQKTSLTVGKIKTPVE